MQQLAETLEHGGPFLYLLLFLGAIGALVALLGLGLAFFRRTRPANLIFSLANLGMGLLIVVTAAAGYAMGMINTVSALSAADPARTYELLLVGSRESQRMLWLGLAVAALPLICALATGVRGALLPPAKAGAPKSNAPWLVPGLALVMMAAAVGASLWLTRDLFEQDMTKLCLIVDRNPQRGNGSSGRAERFHQVMKQARAETGSASFFVFLPSDFKSKVASSPFHIFLRSLEGASPLQRIALLEDALRVNKMAKSPCPAVVKLLDPYSPGEEIPTKIVIKSCTPRHCAGVARGGATPYLFLPGDGPAVHQGLGSWFQRHKKQRSTKPGTGTGQAGASYLLRAHPLTPFFRLTSVLHTAGDGGYRKLYISDGRRTVPLRWQVKTPARAGANIDGTSAERLNLTVAISYKGFIVAGQAGVVTGRRGSDITIPCEDLHGGRCSRVGKPGGEHRDDHDYDGLVKVLKEAKRRYPHEREVLLTADPSVPMAVIVQTAALLPGEPTQKCTGEDACLFDRVALCAGPLALDKVDTVEQWVRQPTDQDPPEPIRNTTGRMVKERVPRAMVKQSRPQIDGTMNASTTYRTLKSGMRCVKARYQRALKRDPGLQGKISVCLTINTSGRVTKVDLDQDTIGDSVLAGQVKSCLRRLRFSPPEGGSAEVCVPYMLRYKK